MGHATTNIEGPRGAEIGGFTDEINDRTDNRFDPDYTRGPMQSIPDHRVMATAASGTCRSCKEQRGPRGLDGVEPS